MSVFGDLFQVPLTDFQSISGNVVEGYWVMLWN